MGLSDSERADGFFNSIKKLTDIKFKADGYNKFKHFNAVLDKLWPSLLAERADSGFWFTGGSVTGSAFGETDIIKCAFSEILSGRNQDDLTNIFPKGSLGEYLNNYSPNVLDLLSKSDEHGPVNVMRVFLESEKFQYYANRYNDELSRSLKKTKNLIAKLQGYCYKEFSSDPIYFSAYLAHHIFEKVLINDDTDLVTNWFRQEHLHHYVKLKNIEFHDLYKTFLEVRKSKELPSVKRMEIIFSFIGKSFHYKHQHNDLLSLVEKHNQNKPEDKIPLRKVMAWCYRSAFLSKEERRNFEYKNYCHLTNEWVE